MTEENSEESDNGAGSTDTLTPRQDQVDIIESDDYPMRVLAGAGTGKTFTLVRKIERELKEGTDPDRILALTFTNKAADSMREKLVEKVGPKGYDIEAYTYHAICHEILQEFAYHADIDPGYDIVTDADRMVLVYEVLDELPYRFTDPDVYDGIDFAKGVTDRLLEFIPAMKRLGIRPGDLREYLPGAARLIELEGVVDRIQEAAEVHLRVGWRSIDADRIEDMVDRLDAFQQVIQDEQSNLRGSEMVADLATYLDAMAETCESFQQFFLANSSRIVEGDLRYAYKLPAYLFGTYSSAPSGLPRLSFTFPEKMQSFLEHCQLLADLTAGYQAYEQRLREESLLDFNDLVLETVRLLDSEPVRSWIDERYDYVFCDEFQDTDKVQFELVRELINDDQLFVVGDDDQAIYEWRGAHVDNIGPRLNETFPNLTDHTLVENFRSNQPILDLANEAIRHLETRGSDKQLRGIGEAANATEGVLTIDAAEELEDEADQIANTVTRLVDGESELTGSSYGPGDIAILVRKKKHARPIFEALGERGIPYELGGDLAAQSPGVETVVAGLKAVANPADEVSLNRVLRMRYRLCESDLERLNTAEELPEVAERPTDSEPTLQDALLHLPSDSFDEPDPVKLARNQLSTLWSQRESLSVTGLYRELKSTLRIEWFLSEQERRDLRALDDIVSSFESGAVQPELSAEFIDYLAHHDTIAEASDHSKEDQPDADRSAVTLLTIHKSKGLEFPVVVLPQLQADEWAPQARTHDLVEHTITGGRPTDRDFERQDEQEARRLLHVGITRAEEWTVLVGRTDDDDGSGSDTDDLPIDIVEEILPDAVPWALRGVQFPIWETIQSSLPDTAVNGTAELAAPVDIEERVAAVDDGETLTRPEARDRVFELVESMLTGSLPSTIEELPTGVTEFSPAREPSLLRRHSYTSLDTLETCTRRHYLDHVVWAFNDDLVGTDAEDGPSPMRTGLIFHETAEQAARVDATTPDEWKSIARQLSTSRGESSLLTEVNSCIDRYFETEASNWDLLASERRFELEFERETIVGQIDAICRRPDGEIVILDYKTGSYERPIDEDLQLPIYVLASDDLLDRQASVAGYVYVGSNGPKIELREYSDDELDQARSALGEKLIEAAESTFGDYTSGEHCRWCPHRSLPCSEGAFGD